MSKFTFEIPNAQLFSALDMEKGPFAGTVCFLFHLFWLVELCAYLYFLPASLKNMKEGNWEDHCSSGLELKRALLKLPRHAWSLNAFRKESPSDLLQMAKYLSSNNFPSSFQPLFCKANAGDHCTPFTSLDLACSPIYLTILQLPDLQVAKLILSCTLQFYCQMELYLKSRIVISTKLLQFPLYTSLI